MLNRRQYITCNNDNPVLWRICTLPELCQHIEAETIWSPISNASHYSDVTMDLIASQITSLTIVYSSVYSSADQRKHQGSASLAFVRGIHRRPVNSPHKGPVTRKMFPFDDVIMMKIFESRLRFHWSVLPKGPINNIPALAQMMAWRQPGDKPLSKLMMVSLMTHICVTRPQWVNTATTPKLPNNFVQKRVC